MSLTKNNPYTLYKTIENIYYLKDDSVKIGMNIFNQLKDDINEQVLNDRIYEKYKDKANYTKYKNIHTINDFFTNENTRLIVEKSYLLIRSSKDIPMFLKDMSYKNNLFVCDFDNKDYFWLDKLKLV